MTTKRVYRAPLPMSHAAETLEEEAGRQFDPDVVDIFLNIYYENGL
jgi:response regulator RpfG family c-di-GMP phosphodiesterase